MKFLLKYSLYGETAKENERMVSHKSQTGQDIKCYKSTSVSPTEKSMKSKDCLLWLKNDNNWSLFAE